MYKKIDRTELERLQNESQLVECKTGLSERKAGCESLCGMLNADTAKGLVLFGIGSDGALKGVEPGNLDKAQLSITQHVREKYDPVIPINLEVLECDGVRIIALSGERPKNVHLLEYDGRAYIREGSSTRRLSLDERSGLLRRRDRNNHQGPWRCDRCGSVAGMLGSIALTDRGIEKSYSCHCGGEWWPAT